jgi:iron(III) transport system permease protein
MKFLQIIREKIIRWRLLEPNRLITFLVAVFIGFYALVPFFLLLFDSFKHVSITNIFDFSLDFTLDNYIKAYSNPRTYTMLLNSFIFTFGSMAVGAFFGLTIAFLVERTNCPLRNITYGLMFVPMVMPGAVKAIAWILLLSPKIGIFNKVWLSLGFSEPLFNAYSLPAMFWVEGIAMAPLIFVLVGAAFRGMDPALEEAAYMAGAGRVTTFFRVTLRLITPAIAGALLLKFIRGIESFEIPLIMGLPSGILVFSTNIYLTIKEQFPPDFGLGFTYSMTLMVLALIGLGLYQRVTSRSEKFAAISGKGYRPRFFDLGKWKWAGTGFIFFYLTVGILLPFGILLWASFLPYFMPPSQEALSQLTLENYPYIFSRPDALLMLKNTLYLGTIATAGAMALALLVSWIVIRLRVKGSRILDMIAFSPYAIPGIVVGVAFLVIFLYIPNPIYGTLWILVLAYVINFLPMGTRFTHSGLMQINKELEEAAAISGAGVFGVFRRIIIPLLLPSLVAGGLYIFLHAVRVMSTAAILYTADSVILPIYIWRVWEEGGTIGPLGALSVVMIVVLTILTILSRRLRTRREMGE